MSGQYASISARRLNNDPKPWLSKSSSYRYREFPTDGWGPYEYRPRAEFTPKQHNPVNPVLDVVRDGWDSGDQWSSLMSAFFAVASILDLLTGETPQSWQYRPSALGSAIETGDYETESILEAIELSYDSESGEFRSMPTAQRDQIVSWLTHAGNVFERLCALYEEAGLSY